MRISLAALLLLLPPTLAIADEPAYVAKFADGRTVEGDKFEDWHQNESNPRLEGRSLLDLKSPARWIRDRRLTPAEPPTAWVEMFNGDVLPGEVVDYVDSASSGYALGPAHFTVRLADGMVEPPNRTFESAPVFVRYVRRLAFDSADPRPYDPGHAYCRDGRIVPFRAARFRSEGVTLLTEQGQETIFFNEIAELHLPTEDGWSLLLDELAELAPSGETLLMQVATIHGHRITASLERYRAGAMGNASDPRQWRHGLQPIWTDRPLWVSNGDVHLRRFWRPDELPLDRAPWRTLPAPAALAVGRTHPAVNENLDGRVLESGGKQYGWGLAVHAPHRLAIELHPLVQRLSMEVGVDQSARDGGCAQAAVFLEKVDGQRLWQSPVLVGSEQPPTAATIHFPAAGDRKMRTLVLEANASPQPRPAGADPLNIRDFVDWLEPSLQLDSEKLRDEIRQRLPGRIAAFNGWEVHRMPEGQYTFATRYLNEDEPPAFRLVVSAKERPLSIRKRVQVGAQDRYLVVSACRPDQKGAVPEIEVRIGGEIVAKVELPERNNRAELPTPVLVPLAGFQGHEVEIELRQLVKGAETWFDWRAIALTPQMPTLYRFFEDNARFQKADPQAPGEASLSREQVHSGLRSVRITPGGRFRVASDGPPVAVRKNPAWGEYRYLRFAFRKVGGGRICVEAEGVRPMEKPARYDAGMGDPCGGQARRVWTLELPDEWIVITRDLAEEFGEMEVRSIALSVPDGEYAYFDQVYLGRSEADLDQIPSTISAAGANDLARAKLADDVLQRTLPAVVAIDFGGRWASGTIVSEDGCVVTSGHAVAKSGQAATVHLPDGKQVAAKTLGIYREADCGLLQLEGEGPWPVVPWGDSSELPPDQLYVGVVHPQANLPKAEPRAVAADVRRNFRQFLWVDLDAEERLSGGPLIDAQGRLLGVQSRQSRFGGSLYTKVETIRQGFDRMKKGESVGSWYPGTGPMLGVDVESRAEGARVTAIVPDTPAAAADVKPGDLIVKVDGASVVSLDDIYRALADKNPGDEATLLLKRGDQEIEKKVGLTARVP